ncbi:MAG: PAS domain S-box protein [Crocinitomicaceae bacterium]|nr:PAS domain S-box protein [Crocinitomicaceae bacterium]
MTPNTLTLDQILENLLDEINANYTFVSKIDGKEPNFLRMVSVFKKGMGKLENFSYEIKGSPCENVLSKDICIYPSQAAQKFPEDEMLVEEGVQGYIGVPLFSVFDGSIIGVFGALYFEPIDEKISKERAEFLETLSPRVEFEMDRRNIANELAENNSIFNAISNQTTEGITVADQEGNYLFVNKAFCQMSGYSEEELLRMRVFDMKAKNQPQQSFYDSKEKYEGIAIRVNLQRKDGTEYLSEIIGDNIEVDGKKVVLGTIRDISEKAAYEKKIVHLNRELEQKVDERTKELEESLQMKQMLLNEVTHRVKNNLQVISSILNIQQNTSKNKETKQVCMETANRIQSMALIHEILYKSNTFSQVTFRDYVDSLIHYLKDAFGVMGLIDIINEVEDFILPIDEATCCGMITSEVVTNAIKYAFDESQEYRQIIISLRKDGQRFSLEIRDNGMGLPEGFDYNESPTLGLQLVESLVGQINGEFDLNNDSGLVVSIQFESLGDKVSSEQNVSFNN